MAIGTQSTRYPDFKPKDVTNPEELSKKLSELTRAIDDKDKRQPNPYDIYGRTLTVDANNLVSDGTITDPDVGTIYVYTITIPLVS